VYEIPEITPVRTIGSEDVSIFFGTASVHCEDLLDYWFH
jgi:hypothetical protein